LNIGKGPWALADSPAKSRLDSNNDLKIKVLIVTVFF
jgi:hypothetical protein